MRCLVIFLTISLAFSSRCQTMDSPNPEQFSFPYDSVQLSVWDIYFKENSLVSDESNAYSDKELVNIQLSSKESKQLVKRLKKKASYDGERALQDHYNLVLSFFHNGVLCQRIEISMMTGNITAHNLTNRAYFRNGCSKHLGAYIEKLLDAHGIIEQLNFDEIDLMGLR